MVELPLPNESMIILTVNFQVCPKHYLGNEKNTRSYPLLLFQEPGTCLAYHMTHLMELLPNRQVVALLLSHFIGVETEARRD